MPPLTRAFIKTGLVYFVGALAVGAAISPGVDVLDAARWTPMYIHGLTVGWLTQIIMGVSWWMFPVVSHQLKRGSEWPGWMGFGFLNAGLLLRVIAEPAWPSTTVFPLAAPLVASAVFQWIGAAAYVAAIWGRVKGKGDASA